MEQTSIIKPLYLNLETNDKEKITSMFRDVIESSDTHVIYTRKLDNGYYSIEITMASDEPPVTS